MTLGEKIRAARKDAGLTQAQMAQMLGVSRQAVTKWETGKGIPDIENLKVMAGLLGMSLDELLDDGTALDLSVTRAPIDLAAYDGRHRRERKRQAVTERFPRAEIHSLASVQKLPKAESLLDTAMTVLAPWSFWGGSLEVARAIDNRNKQFYLVEQSGAQFLVEVTDEWMETRRLAEPVRPDRLGQFTVGDWTFFDGAGSPEGKGRPGLGSRTAFEDGSPG